MSSSPKLDIAVIEYPCSGGAREVLETLRRVFRIEARCVWYENEKLGNPDLVVLPGGFSFGDFLRPAALAKVAPLSGMVANFARRGGRVLGFGNGFQLLCELNLLPGALLQNPNRKFAGGNIFVKVESTASPFLGKLKSGQILSLPLCCYHGRYYASKRSYNDLEADQRIILRYATKFGDVDMENPYLGSLGAIAGLRSDDGKILGMMPRPERVLSSADAHILWESILGL